MKRLQVRDEDLCPKPDPLHREKRLWLAVLTSCFQDILNGRKKEGDRQLKDVGEDWIFSPGVFPGSFEWICLVLEVSPDRIRRFISSFLPGLNQEERRNIIKKLPRRA